jgi:pimeloyl-ACP methyl ester carboxylesterase
MPHAHTADDVSIEYFAAGEGSAVVLVHGITESRRAWDPLIAPLIADAHRVIALDLRGHGDSEAAAAYDPMSMAGDVAAVVAAEGITDPLVVGHSLGGVVVSAYAATAPCRGVINVDQPLELGGFKQQLADIESLLRGDRAGFDAAMTAVVDQLAGPLSTAERRRLDSTRRADQQVVLGIWEPVLTSSAADLEALVEQLASAITAPYLSLFGSDPGPGYTAWLQRIIPHAEVEVWPGLGHYPHLVEPQRFLERLRAFDDAASDRSG